VTCRSAHSGLPRNGSLRTRSCAKRWHAILSGELPVGTQLVQAKLAAQLNASNTPVREALRDLASDQLIRFHPHRGAVVHELDMEEMREIYEIRKALEPLAIRLAAPLITRKQLIEASELRAHMDKETDRARGWRTTARECRAVAASCGLRQERAGLGCTLLYVAHALHRDSWGAATRGRSPPRLSRQAIAVRPVWSPARTSASSTRRTAMIEYDAAGL